MAWDPPWDTAIHCSHAPGVGAGEPRASTALAVWKAGQPRPRLTAMDRIFWLVLSRLWKGWRNSWRVVRPETVVGWHRQGFRRYWAWKSRRRRGRPMIRTDLRDLIRRMSRQSSPGCAEDPRRPAEARPDGIAGDGEAAFSQQIAVSSGTGSWHPAWKFLKSRAMGSPSQG